MEMRCYRPSKWIQRNLNVGEKCHQCFVYISRRYAAKDVNAGSGCRFRGFRVREFNSMYGCVPGCEKETRESENEK